VKPLIGSPIVKLIEQRQKLIVLMRSRRSKTKWWTSANRTKRSWK